MVTAAIIGLLFAAEIPHALMARADEAGMAYVQCLYGVVRQSNAAGLSQSAFEQRLSVSCRQEESSHRALALRIVTLRGDAAPARKVELLERQMRQNMIDEYRTLPEKQRALEDLAALCKAHPDACRQ